MGSNSENGLHNKTLSGCKIIDVNFNRFKKYKHWLNLNWREDNVGFNYIFYIIFVCFLLNKVNIKNTKILKFIKIIQNLNYTQSTV